MNFTWHEVKRKANLKKHGFDFADASKVFVGATVTDEDPRDYAGEQRFNTVGLLETTVVVITHTESDNEIHIISMRKAERHEIRTFFSYF
jgi:uncharacterized protein